jgi:hypothetical protein
MDLSLSLGTSDLFVSYENVRGGLTGSTWSSNLVSGGCQVCRAAFVVAPAYNQDLFTIVPSEQYASSYAKDGPCRSPTIQGSWAPEPEKVLDVKLEGPNGAVSEIGWPACCTS